VLVVVGAVLAVVLTRGGHSSRSISLSPGSNFGSAPGTSSSRLTAPQTFGNFQLVSSDTIGNGVNDAFSGVYKSASDVVLLSACRNCGDLTPARQLQNLSNRFASPSTTTLSSGGTQYVCISGPPSAVQQSLGAIRVCAWQAGTVVFSIYSESASLDEQAIVALAPQAQAATGS
jgi:hypothetical protein